MILQVDYWAIIRGFFNWVAESGAIMMVLSGFMAITWFGYEKKRRGSITKRKVEEQFDTTKFLKGLSYIGLILGIFVVWSGVMSLILDISPSFKYAELNPGSDLTGEANHFTSIFLIVIGLTMFLKPISDLPISSILGLIAATATTFVISMIIPDSIADLAGTKVIKWTLIIIFIIVTAVVAITAKFYIGTMQKISKFLSWPPIAIIIVGFCLVQGFALWGFGVSIFGLNLF